MADIRFSWIKGQLDLKSKATFPKGLLILNSCSMEMDMDFNSKRYLISLYIKPIYI